MMERTAIYLSRLLIDMRSRQVLTELNHPYEMHRTLMKAFPPAGDLATARKEYGVLFRADVDERQRVARVYVQSCVEPDWTRLGGGDGYFARDIAGPAFECKEVTAPLEKIREGQVLAFRLRANPTRRVGRDGDPLKGKRVELQLEAEQIDWLVAKGYGGREGVPGGFELPTAGGTDSEGNKRLVPSVRVQAEGKLKGRKKGAGSGHTMTHSAVLFEGLLRVTDVGAFLETIRRGIGSAKAYGFGLVSLAPVGATEAERQP